MCVFVADEASFGEDLQPWSQVARAIEHFEAHHERVAAAEARCAELQQRVEESEALHTLGYTSVKDVRQGKYFELEIDAASADEARRVAAEAANKLLANPVIESYRIEIESVAGVAAAGAGSKS